MKELDGGPCDSSNFSHHWTSRASHSFTAPSAWLKDAGYADAGWRKHGIQWVEFVLGRIVYTAIYLRRLLREEA